MEGIVMNKETLELKRAIRDGVAEGIRQGLSKVEKPEEKLAHDYIGAAKALKKYCSAQSGCDDCMFEGEFEHCKISANLPQHWDV